MSAQLWLDIRQALLMAVAAIERELKMEPKTADLRKAAKAQHQTLWNLDENKAARRRAEELKMKKERQP